MRNISFRKRRALMLVALAAAILPISCRKEKSDFGKSDVLSAQAEPLGSADRKPSAQKEAEEKPELFEFQEASGAESGGAQGGEESLGADATDSSTAVRSRDALVRAADVDWSAARLDPSQFIAEKEYAGTSIHDNSNLYVLGFSRDGKIAFVESQYLDGVGETRYTFFVQDLVSDEILVRLGGQELGVGENAEISLFAEKGRGKIDEALSAHAVVSGAFTYEPLPYKKDGFALGVTASISETDSFLNEFVKLVDYSIVAEDGFGRKKTIASQTGVADENVFVCGFIKSPWENRLAVVVAEARFGFEGYDIWYSISGCAVGAGF